MSKKEIDLSIVTIALSDSHILNCLESIRKASDNLSLEIILIDNSPDEKLSKLVESKFSEVKIIKQRKQAGYGQNNNLGMKEAKGRYILILNDDTEIIEKGTLKEMIKWMDSNPKVGASTCALLNSDKKTYQGTGGSFPTLFKVFNWMFFIDDIPGIDNLINPYHPMHESSVFGKNENYFRKAHKQDWLTGAFYLMRKEAVDQVGFFDENFFLYVEEVDFSYRLHKKGWELWYLPNWKIIHYGMISTGSENATIMEMQNMKLFYKKHYPKWQLPILTFILKVGSLLRIPLFLILKGPGVAKIYAKAFKSL